jgi:hypothetical protein
MAFYSMMFIGMAPIGALLGGAVASKIGATWTVAIGGSACLAGGILFARRLPSLRGEARELIRAQGILLGEPPVPFSLFALLQRVTRRSGGH